MEDNELLEKVVSRMGNMKSEGAVSIAVEGAERRSSWTADEYTVSFLKEAPISKMGVSEEDYAGKLGESLMDETDLNGDRKELYDRLTKLGVSKEDALDRVTTAIEKNKKAVAETGGYEGIPGTRLS